MFRWLERKSLLSMMWGLGAIIGAGAINPAAAQIVEGTDLSKLPPVAQEKIRILAGTVSILVSGSTCTCAQFAEDIRNTLNDFEELRLGAVRVVPVLGEGGLQNLKDTLFLRGINMAIVDENTLKVLKASNPRAYGDIDKKLRYITKLYNAELHILARKDITSLKDLAGQTVNFDYKTSESDLVGSKVFKTLGIKVTPAYDDQRYALKRLLNGEIAAMVVSSGAPQVSLTSVSAESGLHFLPVDEASLPGMNVRPITEEYLPTELTSELYPNLIPQGQTIPTVASRVLLVIYNWPEDNIRYKRNGYFVQQFFKRIDEFRNPGRHPKWKDVNLAAEVPGWTRFKPAQAALDSTQTQQTSSTGAGQTVSSSPGERKTAFESYLAQREDAGGEPINPAEREALFAEFQKFLDSRKAQQR